VPPLIHTCQAVERKTSDGSDFLRALKKHRELEELEEQEAAWAAEVGGEHKEGEECTADSEGHNAEEGAGKELGGRGEGEAESQLIDMCVT